MALAKTSLSSVKVAKSSSGLRTRRSAISPPPQSHFPVICVCLFLVAFTWLVFGQTLRHEFVNYDDPSYVYDNPTITEGLTIEGVKRAFTQSHARNWHPLTTLSHMLDCQLFGLKPAGHHFHNVLLHTISVFLLFFLFRQMTGALWRSAFVAAIFAIHPLRVESVAWIAERKDVLSGVFFMLTLIAYVRYVRKPSSARYMLVLLLFAGGLMSKPMLVTLPFVLLLLDYWPLRRLAQTASGKSQIRSKLSPLLFEKLPLLALAAASCLTTFLIQKTGGAQADPLPFNWRLGNGVVTYVTYIWQMIWPRDLAPFYPHPEGRLSGWQVTFALLLLLTLTAIAVLRRRKCPYFLIGWLWYLGMLVPVIGIVQAGSQGWADRYTYLPQIGLYLCLAWGVADLSIGWPYRRRVLGAAGAVVLAGFAWIAWVQSSIWRNSESLWRHTLSVTPENEIAHNNFGELLARRGQTDEALSHYEAALRIRSKHQTSKYDFILALTHANLGATFREKGRLDEAIAHYEKAVEWQPDYATGYFGLGSALAEKGRMEDAIAAFRKAVEIRPDYTAAHVGLGDALLRENNYAEAIARYERALEIYPQAIVPLNNLAWLLATSSNDSIRNGPKAVVLAERAVRISGGQNPLFLHKLAAAYAATGDFPRAVETAQRAQQLALTQGNTPLANELLRNLSIYRTNNPLSVPER